jgi:arylsulfatase A-like enzyme
MTPDGTTATRIVQLLAENRDKPFFIAAGFHKPHQPWVGPASFFEQHPPGEIELPTPPRGDQADVPAPAFEVLKDDAQHTERQKKQAIAAYHAMVTMTDSYVGQLLDALELLDLADSTIVVFTSDHGFQLDEHGGLWRKSVQFEESTRVPLIVRLPDGRNAGRTATGLVELVDLYPTFVDLAGLPNPKHALEGMSFEPLLDDPDRRWKSAAFSESRREGFHGSTLREERYRYTEWTPLPGTDGETLRELYDLEEDPLEHHNLAASSGHEGVVADLSRRLAAGWQAAIP